MILLDGILLGLALGLITRGRITRLGEVRIRFEAVFFLCLAVQLITPRAIGVGAGRGWILWVAWIVPAATCAVIAGLNWRTPGMPLVFVGLLLNVAVVASNGGMPVMSASAAWVGLNPATVLDGVESSWLHTPVGLHSQLTVLADVIPIPGPSFHRSLVSIGDVLMSLGAGQLVFVAMHGARRT